jgi:hypothetical protein
MPLLGLMSRLKRHKFTQRGNMLAESDLIPEIIAIGVPPLAAAGGRCKPMLRIKRVGEVFFVENLHQVRTLSEQTGDEIVTDKWVVVAVAKDKDARQEAFQFLQDANIGAIKLSVASPPRVGE